MVGRHCPPNRHGLSTSYRKGEICARWGEMGGRVRDKVVAARGRRGALVADSSLYTAQYTAAWNTGKRHEWSMGFCAVAGIEVYIPPLFSTLTHKKNSGDSRPPSSFLDMTGVCYAAWWARCTWFSREKF